MDISSTCWAMFGYQSETHSAALAILFERAPGGEQGIVAGALRGDAPSRKEAGMGWPRTSEHRLGIEQIDVAGAAFHETAR